VSFSAITREIRFRADSTSSATRLCVHAVEVPRPRHARSSGGADDEAAGNVGPAVSPTPDRRSGGVRLPHCNDPDESKVWAVGVENQERRRGKRPNRRRRTDTRRTAREGGVRACGADPGCEALLRPRREPSFGATAGARSPHAQDRWRRDVFRRWRASNGGAGPRWRGNKVRNRPQQAATAPGTALATAFSRAWAGGGRCRRMLAVSEGLRRFLAALSTTDSAFGGRFLDHGLSGDALGLIPGSGRWRHRWRSRVPCCRLSDEGGAGSASGLPVRWSKRGGGAFMRVWWRCND